MVSAVRPQLAIWTPTPQYAGSADVMPQLLSTPPAKAWKMSRLSPLRAAVRKGIRAARPHHHRLSCPPNSKRPRPAPERSSESR